VEGLATAMEGAWGTRTLHQYAAAMTRAEVIPDLPGLMSFTGFASHSSAASYVTVGSFCRYLIDAYTVVPILRVYGGGTYEEAFGKTLPELAREWKRFLGRIHPGEHDDEVVDALFRQPPIFLKVCPRVVASRNEEARRALSSGDAASALRLYRASFQDGHGAPALGGMLLALLRLREYQEAVQMADSLILSDRRPARFLGLFLPAGDARWACKDTSGARSLYERVRAVNLAERLTEASAVRLVALSKGGMGQVLLHYFLKEGSDSVRAFYLDSLSRLVRDSSGLVRYVQGRLQASMGQPARALAYLEGLDLSAVSRELEMARRKTVAVQLYLLRRYDSARATFWMSLNMVASEAALAETEEWVTRCDWMARHGY
jgi:tetratricopeptide (TPR) repeat protein